MSDVDLPRQLLAAQRPVEQVHRVELSGESMRRAAADLSDSRHDTPKEVTTKG